MIAYCLFCETQKASTVAYILEKRGIKRAFSPLIVRRQRVKGINEDKVYSLLPGYVFVYSDEELNTTVVFRGIIGIVRRLGKQEDGFRLEGADYDFAMNLYRKDGVVGQIALLREGDTVKIEDPLFAHSGGKVTRVDYKKKRARVEFVFAGNVCHTWVACEILKKDEDQA